MTAYYNEFDPFAAQWLRNLIAGGYLPAGDVDERSIVDVRATDLNGYTQCHFFAGIGGWPLALILAGWPEDQEVWTGSCPCQPFSSAGNRRGFDDPRHLWPVWGKLIAKLLPTTVFGEQVASPDGYRWLDLVSTDLERADYAFGAAILPAAGVGAPHARHRTFYVAHATGENDRSGRAEPGFRQEPKSRSGHQSIGLSDANCKPSIAFPKPRKECVSWRSEPPISRVAHGISYRLAQPAIRAFGNAIVPQVCAEFVAAFMEAAVECAP